MGGHLWRDQDVMEPVEQDLAAEQFQQMEEHVQRS